MINIPLTMDRCIAAMLGMQLRVDQAEARQTALSVIKTLQEVREDALARGLDRAPAVMPDAGGDAGQPPAGAWPAGTMERPAAPDAGDGTEGADAQDGGAQDGGKADGTAPETPAAEE